MVSRSSKQGKKGGTEVERLSKLKEESRLSGACIRSLVKQLTSSKTKDPMNPKIPDSVDGDGFPQKVSKFSKGFSETQQTHQSQQPKKQIRRRLHTSKPYQERLLNMAEARREIVTALKFHRAAMKQANEQKQQQSESLQLAPLPSLEQQQEKMNSRRNHRIYPSNTTSSTNYLDNLSYISSSCPPPNPSPWAAHPIAPMQISEGLNFTLPKQTLGLNLNFEGFENLDASLYQKKKNTSIYASSSSSSSPPLGIIEEVPLVAVSPEEPSMMADVLDSDVNTGDLHDEIVEIRSIQEQHQMEWNDSLDLVTSAWWLKFLESIKNGPERKEEVGEDDGLRVFDEVMELPSWLNANESCLLQQQLEDQCSQDYLQDPALPCMDIGEFEGMDGEWLT